MTGKPGNVKLRILRSNAGLGAETRYDFFDVPMRPGMTVLDALFHVLEHQDGSLAFRYSCRSAVCGSCAMFINGRYRLACNSQVNDLGPRITIGPLPHLPVIRDLVVNIHPFFDKIDRVKPYFEPPAKIPEGEFLQSPTERKAVDVAIDCIDCLACFSACPLTWTDPAYPGPAALVKAYRFIADSRDADGLERLHLIDGEDGIWRCHTVFNCADACPKSVNPTHFIQHLKRKATLAHSR